MSDAIKTISVPSLPDSLPFCSAVQVGELIFLSGNLGNKPGKLELVEGGVAAETRQTFENIKEVLEAAGSSLDRVVKVTVFIADMADYAAMNKVYAEVFAGHRPARSTVAVKGLALDAHLEIECIALAGAG